MKTFLLILLPSLVFAGGPKSTFPTPRGLNDEFIQVYHDIANPVINSASISTATFVLNSVGAGSAVLGANCPASAAGAPYTWIVVVSSDGSKVYIPAWK